MVDGDLSGACDHADGPWHQCGGRLAARLLRSTAPDLAWIRIVAVNARGRRMRAFGAKAASKTWAATRLGRDRRRKRTPAPDRGEDLLSAISGLLAVATRR